MQVPSVTTSAPGAELHHPPWSHRRTVLLVLAVIFGCMVPFYAVGYLTDPLAAHSLRTPLDDAIPFLPWTVAIYSLVYTCMLLPAFVVRCTRLFNRTVAAYLLVVAVSLITYVLFPVSAHDFRPAADTIPTDTFLGWGTWLTFTVDPPVNLFPSLHVSSALVAALAAWTARPLYGALGMLYVAGILVTISTMKQHYVVDGVAGVVLACTAWAIVMRGYPATGRPPGHRASTASGLLAYLAFQATFYIAFFIYYRLAVAPA